MQIGWIAYNPYRINVGSIGIRLEENVNEYISPAYVVFSCKTNLLPEYLFLVFKTETFNKVINENTTGSVRQNLSFDKLKDLEIPLPSIQEQYTIVNTYFSKINEANQLEEQAKNIAQRSILLKLIVFNNLEDFCFSRFLDNPNSLNKYFSISWSIFLACSSN